MRAGPDSSRVAADLAAYDRAAQRKRTRFARLAADPRDREWVKRKLAHMVDLDQYMRSHVELPFKKHYSTEQTDGFWREFGPRFGAVDLANTRDLKDLLRIHGWFTIGAWGAEADSDAWLLVQHADADVAFQKEILARLETLFPAGETSRRNYAYLYDRVAVNEGRLQRFGTQGRCAGPGRWEPEPMEDAAGVDERRAAMGLPSMAENKRRLAEFCR